MSELSDLEALIRTQFNPAQHIIHKPNRSGTGQALKLQLRLEPKWINTESGGYFDREANKQGGLFLELVPQSGKDDNGNATFAWRDDSKVIRCKLGIPDITGLLTAIREYRILNRVVPPYLQGKAAKENGVELFHKFERGSTIISYSFDEQQSILRISKGKDLYRSIAITLGEELLLQRYLELALDAYLKVGKR